MEFGSDIGINGLEFAVAAEKHHDDTENGMFAMTTAECRQRMDVAWVGAGVAGRGATGGTALGSAGYSP